MKKSNSTICLALFCSLHLVAQSLTFTSQTQIDSFQVNYPGLTTISGSIEINGDDITNLYGLNVITSIAGGLEIGDPLHRTFANIFLYHLTGLNNVTSIGGDVTIEWNSSLASLTGLENLTSIGGNLEIFGNDELTSIAGLQKLTSIGGNLKILFQPHLASLTGLENLTSIGGGILGGSINLQYITSLVSLAGIANIDPGSIGTLTVTNNTLLSTCDVQSICAYLASPNSAVNIHDNGTSCNNPAEIASACGFTVSCLPYGNYYFNAQSDIDNFQIDFPGCTELEGEVIISGNAITNVDGLNSVASIEGSLSIRNNAALINLSGFENLSSIGGSLTIQNNAALNSLAGLNNVTSIGGNSSIWNHGDIYISYNNALESLNGIDQIESGSILNLSIQANPSLSSCHVQSVCAYLAAPNGTVEIQDNASGCKSPEEVGTACLTAIDEVASIERLSVHPNPIGPGAFIDYNVLHSSHVSLQLVDVNGQIIETRTGQIQNSGEYHLAFDGARLEPGIYFMMLKTNQEIHTVKLIKL